jgi:NTP pyrophosphatase (non-canonical NTP hydrolase)
MNSSTYIENAKKTESVNYENIANRLQSKSMIRILHSALGLSTEAGEILDAVKKHVYYGKELDKVNLFEEVGDLFWYLAIMADELGFSFEDAMKKNNEKLEARYGSRFSSDKAIDRDLNKERTVLEN